MQFLSPSVVLFSALAVGSTCVHAAPAAALTAAATRQQDQQQQDPVRVEESVVVTADREAEQLRDVGSSVSVISSDEIARSGARWLVDVLQFAPGVSVVQSGPAGSVTQVFLRGANSSHTLFLIDGVKVNSPSTGAYDTSGLQLAADQIERIEIVRGPQSALYGSQAVGGVINVITRSGAGAGTWGIEADGGSFSSARVHSWGSGQAGNVRLIGGVSYFDSGGYSAADERNGNLEPDGSHNLSYNGRLDYRSDGGLSLRGVVRGFDNQVEFDGYDFAAGPVDALRNVQTGRETVAGATVGWRGGRFASQAQLSLTDAALESLTPDDFYDVFRLDSSIVELDWQNEVSLPARQTVTAGLEYRREAATSASRSPFGEDAFDEQVNVVGVYAQDRVRVLDRATLTGTLRYEDHSAFGGKWTGRATGTVETSDVVRLHGSVGTGFKAPTLNDLYYPGFSNPDLRPEESVGFDLGVEALLPSRRARVDVTVFRNAVTDLIQFDFVSGRPENLGDVTAAGVELGGEWLLIPTLELSGAYTLTAATPRGSDQQLIRRPRNSGNVRLSWHAAPAARLWGEVRFQGASFDDGVNGREQLDGFAVVNLAGDYRLGSVVLRGRIDNLFDSAYEQVLGFGVAGISGYFGATLTLSR